MFPKCQQNRVYPLQRYFELKIFRFPPDKSYLHCLSFTLMLMSIISTGNNFKIFVYLNLINISKISLIEIVTREERERKCVYIDTDCHCIMLLGLDSAGQDWLQTLNRKTNKTVLEYFHQNIERQKPWTIKSKGQSFQNASTAFIPI